MRDRLTGFYGMIDGRMKTVQPYLILAAFTVVSVLILSLLPPIPQWMSYHQFADVRTIWGIPNFWNVVSNVPFFIVGAIGLFAIKRERKLGNFSNWQKVAPFFVIFTALMLTAIGSSYYHLAPDHYRLAWDRVPMTFIFMGLLSLTIMDRVSFKCGFWLLPFLIALGIWSVWYWAWTESLDRGDLRPYIFVKFYAISLIFMILYLFPESYLSTKPFLFLLIFYAVATICELADRQIYEVGGVISGHTLKHLFAAAGSYGFVVMVRGSRLRLA